MGMAEYKIVYKDGTTQAVTSPGPTLTGEWFTFSDGGGTQLCVRAEEVQTIMRAGIAERTAPEASVKAA